MARRSTSVTHRVRCLRPGVERIRTRGHTPTGVRPADADPIAFEFADALRTQPNAAVVSPGTRHWHLFTELCRVAGAKENLVPAAYFAALAIESGCEWISTDRDYARFPGLGWRHPLS
jgi:hypothetical protein